MKKHLFISFIFLSFFCYAQLLSAVTFNVQVPDNTPSCWLVGNFNYWNNYQYRMNRVDKTHFSLTVKESDFVDATVNLYNLKYKYLHNGGDWSFVERSLIGEDIPERSYQEKDTVLKWFFYEYPPIQSLPGFLTIKVQVPSTVSELYLVGTFCDWALPTDSTKMELISSSSVYKQFSLKVWTSNAYTLQYRYVAGSSWDYLQTELRNYYIHVLDTAAIDVVSKFNNIFDGISTTANNKTLRVHTHSNEIIVDGSLFGESISVVTAGGVVLKTIKSQGDRIIFTVPQGATYLIKSATKTVKVAL